MTNSKHTMVELEVADSDLKRTFTFEHAEALLRLQNNGGWRLPADSNFKFSHENGVELRPDCQRVTGEEQISSYTKSKRASK